MSVVKDVSEMLSKMHEIEREGEGNLEFAVLHLEEIEDHLLRC